MSDLNSVVISKKNDGRWQAVHVPSGKTTLGESLDEAQDSMRALLGVNDAGVFEEPLTSGRFTGFARELAEYLEGPVSSMLAAHSGFARLEAYEAGVAHIRLGGGCQGCPSSTLTLVNGVKADLQDRFGEEVIADVAPVMD